MTNKMQPSKGDTFDNARLAGKPYLAFFGFTHCPDICPTTLFELTDLMKKLGPAANRFNVISSPSIRSGTHRNCWRDT